MFREGSWGGVEDGGVRGWVVLLLWMCEDLGTGVVETRAGDEEGLEDGDVLGWTEGFLCGDMSAVTVGGWWELVNMPGYCTGRGFTIVCRRKGNNDWTDSRRWAWNDLARLSCMGKKRKMLQDDKKREFVRQRKKQEKRELTCIARL